MTGFSNSAALCVNWRVFIRLLRYTILSKAPDDRDISLLSRCVFHITGAAAMVVAIILFQGILTSIDLSRNTEQNTNYSQQSGGCLMSIEIKLGYIGNDIIALCDDAEAEYAFHGKKLPNGGYKARMSSSHGMITSGIFTEGVGTREMVLYSMAKHLEAVAEAHNIEVQRIEALESNKALN